MFWKKQKPPNNQVNANTDLTHRLGEIELLCNIGQPFEGRYIPVDTIEEAQKRISSTKWGNIILEESGNTTAYLSVNYSALYQEWNRVVEDLKGSLMPVIERKLLALKQSDIITHEIAVDVQFNIITIATLSAYKPYAENPFFGKLLEIYESGHLPCGWAGKYPQGTFYVF